MSRALPVRSALAVAVALTACSGRSEPVAPSEPVAAPIAAPGPVVPAVEPDDDAEEDDEPAAAPEPPPPATVARLFVASDPPGYDVYLDDGDQSAGTTPLRLSLPPGAHTIAVAFPGDDDEDDDDDFDALTTETLEGGHEYRFVAVLPNDEDPVEPDAAASEIVDVIRAHRASLDECHVLVDGAHLGFAYDAAGEVTLTQAFGALPDQPLRCGAIEMLSWRLPAGAHGQYLAFTPAVLTPAPAPTRAPRRPAPPITAASPVLAETTTR